MKTNQPESVLLWTILSAAMLLTILFFGLRPKGLKLENPVSIIADEAAISFKQNGIAYVDDMVSRTTWDNLNSFTLELAVEPDGNGGQGFGALLMLHDGSDQRQLFVGQWGSSLVVMNGNDYDHTRRLPRLTAKDAFSSRKKRLVTILAGNDGTYLYLDGELISSNTRWQLKIPRFGQKLRMILGNSVTGRNSWIGNIYGVSIYNTAFAAAKVKRHYEMWKQNKRLSYDYDNNLLAAYNFQSISDHYVEDLSGHNRPLIIPENPIVLEKRFLNPPWKDLKLGKSLYIDVTINLIGFIPLSFVLSGFIRSLGLNPKRRYTFILIIFCCCISLIIEILQGWMATRSSSMLDLILNTISAYIGIWLFNKDLIVRKSQHSLS